MNRSELVTTLELLKPALAKHDTIPIFQCFTFQEGRVTAYNDILAVSGPTECEDDFGVQGNIFLGMLSANTSEEVDLTLGKSELVIKCGKSTSKLPFRGVDEFIFEAPDGKQFDEELQITQTVIDGLKLCRETVSTDETQAALHGITIVGDCLYSCNGDAVTRVSLPVSIGKSSAFIPTPVCDAILRIWEHLEVTSATLFFSEQWICAEFSDWDVYGRLPEIKEPLNYPELVKRGLQGKKGDSNPVPEGFDTALSRARVLADLETSKTSISVSKGKITLYTETQNGEVEDLLAFKGHADIEVNVSASHIQGALKHCDHVMFLEHCTMFEKEDTLLLVSHMS